MKMLGRIVTLGLILVPVRPLHADTPAVLTTDQGVSLSPSDLLDLPLDQLINVTVATASRKQQRLMDAAVSAYVVTAADIQQMGATSIPEALRMVPGLIVDQANGNSWDIDMRNQAWSWSNSLLTLMDGRSLFSPLIGGTNWSAVQIPMSEIERIEIVRGSGGALWGFNAVSGIINIITKKGTATSGVSGVAWTGTRDRANVTSSVTMPIGADGALRVNGFFKNQAGTKRLDGSDNQDSSTFGSGAFRFDANNGSSSYFLQGRVVSDQPRQRVTDVAPPPVFEREQTRTYATTGYHLIGKVTKTLSEKSEVSAQMFFNRSNFSYTLRSVTNTSDVELQQRYRWSSGNELVWGGNLRVLRDHVQTNSFADQVDEGAPAHRTLIRRSLFAQNDLTLYPDALTFTLGLRLEKHSFSSLAALPTARLLWKASPTQAVWVALSKARRASTRFERDGVSQVWVPGTDQDLPIRAEIRYPRLGYWGDQTLTEVGWRSQLAPGVSVDMTAFAANLHRVPRGVNLIGVNVVGATDPYYEEKYIIDSSTIERNLGFELAIRKTWSPRSLIEASYSLYNSYYTGSNAFANSERSRTLVRGQCAVSATIELGALLRYEQMDRQFSFLRDYFEADGRIGWQITDQVQVSLIGRNLVHPYHREGGGNGLVPSAVPREVLGTVSWQF